MILIYILNLINLVFMSIICDKFLHIFQLKTYNIKRYFSSLFCGKFLILQVFNLFFTVFSIIFMKNIYFLLIFSLITIIVNAIYIDSIISSKKTPIVYTKKLIRIYILSITLLIIISCFRFSICLSYLILFCIIPVANSINIYDKIMNKIFIKKAIKKLQNQDTKIIAITGSNGKTSIKNILHQFLSKKYITQATPHSYNTPLGISKFINEKLENSCEFLILEFGARHIGDIKSLCKMFSPKSGVISLVAAQHIETFKSVENIYIAKKELADYLDKNLCIYNTSNYYTQKMYNEKQGEKASVSIHTEADIFASNIKIIDFETRFKLHIENQIFETKTRLLGKHNILNILLACSMARYYNVEIQNIINAIENLKPTPHRLEFIKTHINILDDSYNCSLASATESLEVLSMCPNQKIVVTPGIIEGGKKTYELNFELGKMLSIADKIIIIGETNKLALSNGLIYKNYDENNIIFHSTLDDAKSEFVKLKENDTLLILNDLPDDYK